MDTFADIELTVPRSCLNCNRKKIRCDRKQPCNPCSRSGASCIYPDVNQRKRARKFPINALLCRLQELEKKVSTLTQEPKASDHGKGTKSKTGPTVAPPGDSASQTSPRSTDLQFDNKATGVLYNQGGDSRYFGDSFIASLARDAKELDPEADQVVISGDKAAWYNNFQPFDATYFQNQPPADARAGWRALRLWSIYQSHVEPILKMLHVPTAQPKLYSAMQNPQSVGDAYTMLLNAVCFSAMLSIDDEESRNMFEIDRQTLTQHYREEAEKYIGKFSLMTNPNIEYLQALTIFITALRVIDNTRGVWVLVGLAIRVAKSLGIHMEGQEFGLSPFDCEIRRRLWWHIFLLEIRAAEDHGVLVSDLSVSKKPPLYPSNVNDEDIWPEMTDPPIPSKGTTSMTLTILRILFADKIINMGLYPLQINESDLIESVETSQTKVRESYSQITDNWMSTEEHKMQSYYPAGKALLEFSLKKSDFLILFRAYQSASIDPDTKESIRARAVEAAIDVIEILQKLESSITLKRFVWYSRSYPQWFTIGFLLQQLYRGFITDQETRERVCKVIESVFQLGAEPSHDSSNQRRGAIWMAIRLLRDKALASYPRPRNRAVAHSSSLSSGPSEFTTPDSTELEALDSIIDFNDFDFAQMGPADLYMFDSQVNVNAFDF